MTLNEFMQWLFQINTVQMWWYVTRSAGIIAYLLLWFSTVWGLAVPSKIFDKTLHGVYTFDFHQFISLLAIGFTMLHMGVLMLDKYLPYSLVQVLVPFTSAYRPVWIGIGIIAFWLMLLVTVTFYVRRQIGTRAFRVIHWLSFLAFIGAALHGIFSGTDTPLWSMKLVYETTFISVVFLTVYWLVRGALGKIQASRQTA